MVQLGEPREVERLGPEEWQRAKEADTFSVEVSLTLMRPKSFGEMRIIDMTSHEDVDEMRAIGNGVQASFHAQADTVEELIERGYEATLNEGTFLSAWKEFTALEDALEEAKTIQDDYGSLILIHSHFNE